VKPSAEQTQNTTGGAGKLALDASAVAEGRRVFFFEKKKQKTFIY
jgi:hypothetical protein